MNPDELTSDGLYAEAGTTWIFADAEKRTGSRVWESQLNHEYRVLVLAAMQLRSMDR